MQADLIPTVLSLYEGMLGHGARPNPIQKAVAKMILSPDAAGLVMAPTGSGKTEAVLVPSLARMANGTDGARRVRLIMVYPARSLLEDQKTRLACKAAPAFVGLTGRPFLWVLDYGGVNERVERLPDGTVRNQKGSNHYYFGDVILTTLDSFIYRLFGYGSRRKSYIFPQRIMGEPGSTIVCFDEAHSYDDVAFTNFVRLVEVLYENDVPVICMTATMPEEIRKALPFTGEQTIDGVKPDSHLAQDYAQWEERAGLAQHPARLLEVRRDSPGQPDQPAAERDEAITRERVEIITRLAQERSGPGRRVIVTTDTIRSAVEVWQHLMGKVGNVPVHLYHGRLVPEVRRTVYGELSKTDRDDGAYVLVTTSAIEVGCDLNAHELITECCFPERLIQRAGRCNRRKDIPDARVTVVGERPLSRFGRTMSKEAMTAFTEALGQTTFDAEAFRKAIERDAEFDYRAQMLFDKLYRYVYEADTTWEPLYKEGIIATRSWEPTVTLAVVKDPSTNDPSDIAADRCVTVPISWLRGSEEALASVSDDDVRLVMRSYEEDENDHSCYARKHRVIQSPRGGLHRAWKVDLVVLVREGSPYYESDEAGFVNVPRVLGGGQDKRDPYRMKFWHKGKDGSTGFWYAADETVALPVETGAVIV